MNNYKLKCNTTVIVFLCSFCLLFLGSREGVSKVVTSEDSLEKTVEPSREMLAIQESNVEVALAVKQAVVNISVVHIEEYSLPQHDFFFGSPFDDFFNNYFSQPKRNNPDSRKYKRKYEGTGSGVVIEPEGYILTNEHVIRGADEIKVILFDEKDYLGRVIGTDERTDLAIIKIDTGKDIPYARLGNSDKIRVGEFVIAIGSPFGLEQTVTSGIISAVRQSFPIEGRHYSNLVQTDAAINRGNSGGPLCNIRGEVIGINTLIYSPSGASAGVGFAIPINSVKEILDDLIHKGKVIRGWLGVEIKPVDKIIAKQFNLKKTEGVLINNVVEDSPAEKSGLKRGDVIVSFNGEVVSELSKLQSIVQKTKPKTKVKIGVVRNGKDKTLFLVTGEMPLKSADFPKKNKQKPENEPDNAKWLGIEVVKFDKSMANMYRLKDDEKGCLVVDVEPGSVADEIGVLKGDLIRSVNRKTTDTLDSFNTAVKKSDIKDGIIFDINRQGRLLYITYMAE